MHCHTVLCAVDSRFEVDLSKSHELEIQIMEKQDSCRIPTLVEKSDHQLKVDGVIYRELKTLDRVVIQVFLQITNN